MDLALRNRGDVFALFCDIERDDVRLVAQQPWVSFCSDAESLSSEVAMKRGGIDPGLLVRSPACWGTSCETSKYCPCPKQSDA